MSWIPPTLARICLGLLFLETGWGKLHDIGKVVGYFGELGIPAPDFMARLVATTELACGGLLLIGLLARLATIPLVISMTVAIITAKREQMESFTDLVMFPEFLFVLLLIWIGISGPGPLSIDRGIGRYLTRGNRSVPKREEHKPSSKSAA